MRRIIPLIFILFISNDLISQTYYSFPDSNAIWSVNYTKFGLRGDTLVNNKVYKKYYTQFNDSIFNFSKCTYFAAIREDSMKIYGIKNSENKEYLLYDFTVLKGETIGITNFAFKWLKDPIELNVVDVDSVFIYNGYRKRIILK